MKPRSSTARKGQRRAAVVAHAAFLLALGALVFVVWCAVSATALAQTPPPASVYQIIIHPKNPKVSVPREFAAQSFLKKVVTWGHGGVIRPVDLTYDSPVRRKFSEEILGRSVAAVRNYWLQIVFSGRGVPPTELGSDDDVIRFVMREPGAIGYVSSRADTHQVRVLIVDN